jgi:ATP/maltotriose-dependent transcriptional regulator MalT
MAERSRSLPAIWTAQITRARLDLLRGHPDVACTRLAPLLDRLGAFELYVIELPTLLAWAHLELGDVTAAEDVARQAIERTRAGGYRPALVDALWVQAMVAIRQGQWAEAEQALEEGLSPAQSMPYPYGEGRLLHAYGEMHVQ